MHFAIQMIISTDIEHDIVLILIYKYFSISTSVYVSGA